MHAGKDIPVYTCRLRGMKSLYTFVNQITSRLQKVSLTEHTMSACCVLPAALSKSCTIIKSASCKAAWRTSNRTFNKFKENQHEFVSIQILHNEYDTCICSNTVTKNYLSCYSCSDFVEGLVEGLGSNWVWFWPLSVCSVQM